MGGVTIAHQPMSNESKEENYSFPSNQSVNEDQLNQLLASSQWTANLPMEDLTGEVQDLMMRESMNNWLDPWINETSGCVTDFDAQLYAQSLQLSNLFGQGDIHFGDDTAGLYDELTFVTDDSSLTMSATTSSVSSPSTEDIQISPSVPHLMDAHMHEIQPQLFEEHIETIIEETQPDTVQTEVIPAVIKRRRESTSSEGSSDSSSSEEEESESEQEVIIPTTVANMNSRNKVSYSSGSDSESEAENTPRHRSRAASPVANPYVFMHKRQIEETLLERITNQLHQDKLPGILPIISDKSSSQQEDEVEIDLSCLPREQLVQVLSYVDACILEQNGGPRVNVEDFIVKKPKGPRTRPALSTAEEKTRRPLKRSRKPRQPRRRSRAELTEDLDADSDSDSDSADSDVRLYSKPSSGPISMASLAKKVEPKCTKPKPIHKKNTPSNSHRRRRPKVEDDVVASIPVFQDPDSIAISRPKRRAAVHKRRLLEQMLAPSDNEEEDDNDEGVLVLYSDEQMDLGVVDNKTIAHQPTTDTPLPITATVTTPAAVEESEDTDEEIDIMC